MNTLPAAAAQRSVGPPAIASLPAGQREAQDVNQSPFSQALSEADPPGSHRGASPHRARGNADGKAVPPDGNATPSPPPPSAAAEAVPAAAPPAVATAEGAAPQVSTAAPAISSAPAVAALARADVTRGPAGAAATNAVTAGVVRPPVAGRASDTVTRATNAAATAQTDGGASTDIAAAAEAGATTAGIADAGKAAQAAAEPALAVPDRLAEPESGTLPASGKPAATLQLPTAAGGAVSIDADPQPGGATTAGGPVLPVFSLQGAAERHDDQPTAGAPGPRNGATLGGAAASAAELGGLAAAQGAASPALVTPAPPQPASSHFPEQLAAHVAYVVDQSLNGATLQVSPPQLGPIELRVSIEAGHAQVWLSAHNATTVDALQQGSAKLRELLVGQGFGQVSVNVSQRSFQERHGGAPAYVFRGASDAGTVQVAAIGTLAAPVARRPAPGSLDAYA